MERLHFVRGLNVKFFTNMAVRYGSAMAQVWPVAMQGGQTGVEVLLWRWGASGEAGRYQGCQPAAHGCSERRTQLVSSATKLDFTQGHDEQLEVIRKTSRPIVMGDRKFCPRCNSQLQTSYDEPECLQCGYVDYTYTNPLSYTKKKSIISAGTEYILRYVGDSETLMNTLTYVKVVRVRNRLVYGVSCPFCGRPMVQSSLSGKRREVREERYKCTEGHRVSLTPGKNGSLGWK